MKKDKFEYKEILKEYQKTWDISENLKLEQNKDLAWQKLAKKIHQSNNLISIRELNRESVPKLKKDYAHRSFSSSQTIRYQAWYLRIAAVLLVAVCVLYVLNDYNLNLNKEGVVQSEMKEVAAERGERIYVTFSDGSSVVLNSSSVIRFPSKFEADRRQVELEGEAFFSVARKENTPFLVHTNGVEVRVLGTKFNVNSYSSDEKVEVVVAEGKVAVRSETQRNGKHDVSLTNDKSLNEVILTEEEYTLVKPGAVPSAPEKINLERYLGWIKGSLIFEATPLDMVIRKLELYYDQDFIVADSSLYDQRLTALFDKESLSKVLEVLATALEIEYEQKDSLIYLKRYEQGNNREIVK